MTKLYFAQFSCQAAGLAYIEISQITLHLSSALPLKHYLKEWKVYISLVCHKTGEFSDIKGH